MKCVVIGGSGFVGRWLVKELLDRGDRVVNCDIVSPAGSHIGLWENEEYICEDKGAPEQILGSSFMEGVDEVYDLGAVVGTRSFSPRAAMKSVNVNIVGTLATLWAADRAGVKRYYYPAVPADFANTYTVTKKAGEMLCKIFEGGSSMEIKLLRWGNIYGPGQALTPKRLVPTTIMAALAERPIQVYGEGKQMVEMIYVKDVARLTVQFMREGPAKKMYDVDCESFVPVYGLVGTIRLLVPSDSQIVYLPMRPGEEEIIDEAPVGGPWLSEVMPLGDMTPLAQGLTETIEWYRKVMKKQ